MAASFNVLNQTTYLPDQLKIHKRINIDSLFNRSNIQPIHDPTDRSCPVQSSLTSTITMRLIFSSHLAKKLNLMHCFQNKGLRQLNGVLFLIFLMINSIELDQLNQKPVWLRKPRLNDNLINQQIN